MSKLSVGGPWDERTVQRISVDTFAMGPETELDASMATRFMVEFEDGSSLKIHAKIGAELRVQFSAKRESRLPSHDRRG